MSNRMILNLEDITLSFGGKPLFEGLSMHICEKDRICLVGKNGVGKTTLMRLMVEDLELDAGSRFIFPGTRVGYLAQNVRFSPKQTVRDFVLSGLPKEQQNEHSAYLADIVIAPLGLDGASLMAPLSGGQLRRAALARALVEEPDILLLDEPTNHLDLQAIEWLEEYLQYYSGAVVCISHDRQFLANISHKVLWMDRGGIKICPYGYGQFEEWLEKQIEQEARELQNLKQKVEAEQDWTQGGVTGRRKRNVRRLRELGRLREQLQKDKAAYKQRSQKIEMDALDTPSASKVVTEFKRVTKSFTQEDGKKIPILKDFSHTILKGDRLGILGRNGSGKSSFIKLINEEIFPDSGHIARSKSLDISYFDQNRSDLDPNKTLWDTLCPNGGQEVFIGMGENRKSIHVCGYLKKFLFDPKIARDKVGTLSGGQQNRLLLAKILASPGNLLILDEPTNDLDIDTLDMLQNMLADYPGTLIIVSHDRDFLDRTATEILAFEGDAEVENIFGGYSDYIRHKKQKEKQKMRVEKEEDKPNPPARHDEFLVHERENNTPASKKKGALRPLTYGEEIELKKLPSKIEQLEKDISHLQTLLDDAEFFARDPDAFHASITAFDAKKNALEQAESKWLELEERAGERA